MIARIRMEVLANPEEVAARAAGIITLEARAAIASRDRFLLATSGGTTPWRMLELFAAEALPWQKLQLFQVDERIVSISDPARNLHRLQSIFLTRVSIPVEQVQPMPVEELNHDKAIASYTRTLHRIAGNPPQLDLIHLGLGADGHTASLLPGDVPPDTAAQVAISRVYQGTRRMTLTLRVINEARCILWVVTGVEKAEALSKLLQGDLSIPAAHVSTTQALLLVDADLADRL